MRVHKEAIGFLFLTGKDVASAEGKVRREMKEMAGTVAQFVYLGQKVQEFQEGLLVDGLTGLYNSRYFWRRLEEEIARSRRSRAPFSVAVLDIDGLKKVNDRYGHLAGDKLVASFGYILKSSLRASDVIARYGGDEFGAILLDADKPGAFKAIERIQNILRSSTLSLPQGAVPFPTCSIGVASFPDDGEEARVLFDTADKALYADRRRRTPKKSGKPIRLP